MSRGSNAAAKQILLKLKTNLKNFAFSRRTHRQRATNSRCSRGDQLSEPSGHTAEHGQRSYLFAEARNRRSSGIGVQNLPFGSKRKSVQKTRNIVVVNQLCSKDAYAGQQLRRMTHGIPPCDTGQKENARRSHSPRTLLNVNVQLREPAPKHDASPSDIHPGT
jgi:hypothetical protein